MQKIIAFSAIEEIGAHIMALLAEKIAGIADNDFVTVALSGGSTPRQIFKYIAANEKGKIIWNKVKLFWGDERCVGPEHDESNFKMTKENLLNHITIPAENVFRIKGENIPADEAKRYSAVVAESVKPINGLPRFDIVLLGLGEDGHTASVFPGNEILFQSANICEAVVHPQTGQQRITLTGSVINNAAAIIFLVTGQGKASVVSRLLNNEAKSTLPAAFVKPVNGELQWLLDSNAASLLH